MFSFKTDKKKQSVILISELRRGHNLVKHNEISHGTSATASGTRPSGLVPELSKYKQTRQ